MFHIRILFIVCIYESCRVNELMQLLNNTNKDSQVKVCEQRLPQDVPDCLPSLFDWSSVLPLTTWFTKSFINNSASRGSGAPSLPRWVSADICLTCALLKNKTCLSCRDKRTDLMIAPLELLLFFCYNFMMQREWRQHKRLKKEDGLVMVSFSVTHMVHTGRTFPLRHASQNKCRIWAQIQFLLAPHWSWILCQI